MVETFQRSNHMAFQIALVSLTQKFAQKLAPKQRIEIICRLTFVINNKYITMRNILQILGLILLIILLFILLIPRNEEKAKAREELKLLMHRMRKKQKILAMQERFKSWRDWIYLRILFPGYFVLLAAFIAVVFATGIFFGPIENKGDFATHMVYAEGIIAFLFLLRTKKAMEITQIMTNFAPQLRKWVYGKREDIDQRIKDTKSEIARIGWRIDELNTIINS